MKILIGLTMLVTCNHSFAGEKGVDWLAAAAAGNEPSVLHMLDNGIDANTKVPPFDATALHNAAANNQVKIIEILLAAGADANIKDKRGYSALDWARYHDKTDAFARLKAVSEAKNPERPIVSSDLPEECPDVGSIRVAYAPESNEKLAVEKDSLRPKSGYSKSANSVELPAFQTLEQRLEHHTNLMRNRWEKGAALPIPWTELQLHLFVKHKQAPSRGARALALVHVAMADAYHSARKSDKDVNIAVHQSASQVLAHLFPSEEDFFQKLYARLTSNFPKDISASAVIGAQAADRAIERALNDGAQRGWDGNRLQWYGEGRFYGPGSWEPTAPYFYYPPEEPFAPTWKPWALNSASQFRPEPPPAYGSDEFLSALREVLDVTRTLTPEQFGQAKFWVDGNGSVTPAGHWNQIAIEALIGFDADDESAIDLLAALNVAMADTFIAAWESKYHYWFIRPSTAARKMLNIQFEPPILTPPFPSYVSGHAATSGAAAKVLSKAFPNRAGEFKGLGEQAAMSRLYGGIHFRFDNDEGLKLGRKVATHVMGIWEVGAIEKRVKEKL